MNVCIALSEQYHSKIYLLFATMSTKTGKKQINVSRQMRDGAWFVRIYGEIIYRPYRRKNHALSHLYHDIQCGPCTLRIKIGYLWIVVQNHLNNNSR